jgi:hypothetical protein
MKPSPTAESINYKSKEDIKIKKETFKLNKDSIHLYNLTIGSENSKINIFVEKLNDFPILYYELNTSLEELYEKDENLSIFNSIKRLIHGIKTCIESEKYSFSENEFNFILTIENDFFENKKANIEIPIKEQDLKIQINSLTKIISELKKEINELKMNKPNKELKIKIAKESITNSSFLTDEDKVLLSEWIDPVKIIRFSLLFNSSKDGASSSTFHYYCDGAFPTITVIYDTAGRKFGGYTTQSWSEPKGGSCSCRDEFAFIFNLSNKQKYELIDKFYTGAISRGNSYGPTFGGGNDLYIANSCTGNTSSYVSKSSYNTGNNNLLGGSSSTSFQVTYYEVYKVIFE